ncbi:tyrosine-type recombinase/integrase [Marinobacter sp. bablab_jr008]|uniref:tyrosine-type recombinase/integrase n=1 Tax=Marinobacter sp. bablab_jr008 TaxID=2755064 RepID=UPI0018F16354|nr:tyrosine-type recombinase/integrase [Marinobacter sp. bablab_jr008]
MKYEVNRAKARKRNKQFSGTEIGQYIADWLESKRRTLADSTYTNYRAKARLIDQYFKRMNLRSMRKKDIKKFLSYLDTHGYSNKTINEYLIVLRGVLDDVVEDGLIDANPTAGISNLQTLKPEPDPFESSEVAVINAACPIFCSEIALFQLGLFTGLRISELLGLAWEDIDFEERKISVTRAKVQGKLKAPKNKKSKRVLRMNRSSFQLLGRLRDLNQSQKAKSYTMTREDNKTEFRIKLRMLFLNSSTGSPISNESYYAKYFFKPLLKRAGVRYRGPNTARHTFASQMLTQGLPLAWIAAQLGHETTTMLFRNYGKYIENDAPDYSAQLEQVFQSFEASTLLEAA